MKWILLSLSIITIIFIFSMSLCNGNISSNQSGVIVDCVLEITGDAFNKEVLHIFIRKLAHFTIFSILGLLWSLTFLKFKLNKYYLYGIIVVILVAFIDETIQTFIDGRVGSIYDSLLDIIGGLTSISILLIINYLKRKKSNLPKQ